METFTYTSKSQPVFYKGNTFDSLLELKYAIMIEDTHAWLRDGFEIYYGLNKLHGSTKGHYRCYRPDFLVRNWTTGEARLVEIKPDGFNEDSLQKRRGIATRFIQCFAYDWSYQVVFASQINLSPEQWHLYKNVLNSQQGWQHKPCMGLPQNHSPYSDSDYHSFVCTGLLPAVHL